MKKSFCKPILIVVFSLITVGMILGADSNTGTRVPTLSMTLWSIGMVDENAAAIERRLGNDPITLIEPPKASNWTLFPQFGEMQEVAIVVPSWWVKDGSGMRLQATVSVFCDKGQLFLDTIHIPSMVEDEGEIDVLWSFNGETSTKSIWSQKDTFILPKDDFPHDSVIRRLLSANYLVLQVDGKYDTRPSRVPRAESGIVIAIPLWGDKSGVRQLIARCDRA